MVRLSDNGDAAGDEEAAGLGEICGGTMVRARALENQGSEAAGYQNSNRFLWDCDSAVKDKSSGRHISRHGSANAVWNHGLENGQDGEAA